ncbi:MAG: phosphoenolpyruvate synthase [Luteitalea sp.]|nr:phosphoenolpyruvate synthase [Luteitalea sp.]
MSAGFSDESVVSSLGRLPVEATASAGGKGASLSRMSQAGLPVPPGFVVCASAFGTFLNYYGGVEILRSLTRDLDVQDNGALEAASARMRDLIVSNPLPTDLSARVRTAYHQLGVDLPVAIRSSAVSEDGEAASFAGQQDTFLNTRGIDAVLDRLKLCWASFFASRALFYRSQKGALDDTRIAVVVQEMVQADKSGVMFTMDPVQKLTDRLVIEAVFGLGEGIVSGLITPDHYVVGRDDGALLREFIASQETAVVYDGENGGTRQARLSKAEGSARVLSGAELSGLRELGLRLETFFGGPQDVEWCIREGDLRLLQSRPITTL